MNVALVLAVEGLCLLAAFARLVAQPTATLPANVDSPAAARDADEPATRGWMEVRVAPLADTFVREGNGTIYGDRKWLEIGEGGSSDTSSRRWSFLKFDTSGAAHVSSARLRLYGARSSKGVDDTWANALSASSWYLDQNATPLDRVKLANDKTDRWYEWDVSDWVVRERAAGRHVVTLILVSEIKPPSAMSFDDGVAFFHSLEADANPPELVLVP